MSLDVHVATRGHLRPDPHYDGIACLVYNIQNNVPAQHGPSAHVGIVVVVQPDDVATSAAAWRRIARSAHRRAVDDVCCVSSEHELFEKLVCIVRRWDPDIFAGYEIEMASWGYVLQRAQLLDIRLKAQLSRIVPKVAATNAGQSDEPSERSSQAAHAAGTDFYGTEYVEYEVRLSGRIFLDVWRLMKPEMALTSYTFENCVYHVLHRRCPKFGFGELTEWWWSGERMRWMVVEYYVERVVGTLELLNQLDLIGRTCELAKLFGIQFFEVLSRGSQFRVESMMLR